MPSRPALQHLGDGEQAPAGAEELGEGMACLGRPPAPEAGKERERGERVVEPEAGIAAEARMEPDGSPVEAGRLEVEVDEGELEGVGKTDVLELEGGGRGAERVPGIERPAKARVGRPLRRHEQMFAQRPRFCSAGAGKEPRQASKRGTRTWNLVER
jgi:hypothetical protein